MMTEDIKPTLSNSQSSPGTVQQFQPKTFEERVNQSNENQLSQNGQQTLSLVDEVRRIQVSL